MHSFKERSLQFDDFDAPLFIDHLFVIDAHMGSKQALARPSVEECREETC